jgi:hypothetical protein
MVPVEWRAVDREVTLSAYLHGLIDHPCRIVPKS